MEKMQSLWIARDKNGYLYEYTEKPKRRNESFVSDAEDMKEWNDDNFMLLPDEMYPEVTWENSPFELTIKSENNGK